MTWYQHVKTSITGLALGFPLGVAISWIFWDKAPTSLAAFTCGILLGQQSIWFSTWLAERRVRAARR